MTPETQWHILKLACLCKSVDKICVFRAKEFSTTDHGIQLLFNLLSLHFSIS
jgi:hypothetical protein